jgi:hypothetical protein
MAFDASQLAEIRAEINKAVDEYQKADPATGIRYSDTELARIRARDVARANASSTNPGVPYVRRA